MRLDSSLHYSKTWFFNLKQNYYVDLVVGRKRMNSFKKKFLLQLTFLKEN